MAISAIQILTGRISLEPQIQTNQPFIQNNAHSHGHMAPTLRGRKNLVCFYCNKKSGIKYDGLVRQWECTQCESTNFLDENGEITDPPVATDYAAPNVLQYAIPPPHSLPSQGPDSDLFCTTCLKNQHLFTASLAQYDVELDTKNPQFREREREYYAYRKNLEKRYPQVCEDCEPKVLERMREAGKTAKTDYLRRLMERTRERRSKNVNKITLSGTLESLGKCVWYVGLAGQLLWNIMALAAAVLHLSTVAPDSLDPIPALMFLEAIISVSTSVTWARSSLFCSIATMWWNPMFKQMNNGFMNHIKGFGDWYKFQMLMIVSRSIFYYISGTGILADPYTTENAGAHLFSLGFITVLAIKARGSLKLDMTPLWAATPEKLSLVGPKPASPKAGMDTMADALDQIAATPRRGPSMTPSPSAWDCPQNQTARHRDSQVSIPHYKARNQSSAPVRAGPSLLDMTHSESAHYLATGEVPARLNQASRETELEGMDWTTSQSQSQHRAFNAPHSIQRNTQLFRQAPTVDQPSPFWYKVPPAPTTPAQRLRNPPNQPRLRVSSQEVKENFFNNVTRRLTSLEQHNASISIGEQDRPGHEVEFSQQKFFPPPPASEAGNNLADLLTSFSLGSSETETPKIIERSSRIRHTCQGLVLFIGLFFWNFTFANPTDHSRNVMLVVMAMCAFVGARTILDSAVLERKQQTISRTLGVVFGCLECAFSGYGVLEILAGRGYCDNCASLGTVLIGGMLVYEGWLASFGY